MTTWWQRTTKTYSGETTLDQGSDGSSEYLNNKRIRFVIGQYNTGASVSFKPFLTKYSVSLSQKIDDESKDYIGTDFNRIYAKDSLGYEISLSFDLLAHSLNEAIINNKRINEFSLMFSSFHNGTDNWGTTNIYIVSLANLIGAKYTSSMDLNNFDKLKKVGVPCFIDSYDFSIDKEMGMFENPRGFLPKKYTMNFTLKVGNANYGIVNETDEYLWLPLDKDGINFKNDIRTFPFGIKTDGFRLLNDTQNGREHLVVGKSITGTDGSNEYSQNTRSKIYLGLAPEEGSDIKGMISFKAFLNDISWNYSLSKQVADKPKTSGIYMTNKGGADVYVKNKLSFDVINHSTNEARNNMFNLQQMLRMIDQYRPNITSPDLDPDSSSYNIAKGWSISRQDASKMYVLIPSIINKKIVDKSITSYAELVSKGIIFYVNAVTFDFDLSMGFFEYGGLLYFKKFSISLELTRISKKPAGYKTFEETPTRGPTWNGQDEKATNNYVFKL